MTYCIAMNLQGGLVFGSDTRTNAGVDHIATFRKLYTFSKPGSHAIVLLCSGNLATSQSLIEHLKREVAHDETNILTHCSMFDVADHIGGLLLKLIETASSCGQTRGVDFSGNLLVGGQIKGEAPRLFQVYPQGNFIEATVETPYLQIGEEKYGKPILDRIINYQLPLELALRCAFVSLDSTIKSNLSVGLPLDLLVYDKDSFDLSRYQRIEEYDEGYLNMRQHWSKGVRTLLETLPTPKL